MTSTRIRAKHFGMWASFEVTMNDVERVRREQAGLGGLVNLDVLNGLLNLPLGLPVALEDLTTREQRLVDRLPSGVVKLTGNTVTRLIEPVITIKSTSVAARSWQRGLVNASQFAPYCTRSMVLRDRPVDETNACTEASYYGVGIILQSGATLIDPEPWTEYRVTAAGWWFTEELYQQML